MKEGSRSVASKFQGRNRRPSGCAGVRSCCSTFFDMCSRPIVEAKDWFVDKVADAFENLGCFVYDHAWKFIIIPTVICAFLSLGMLKREPQLDMELLYSLPSSPSLTAKYALDAVFPIERIAYVFAVSKDGSGLLSASHMRNLNIFWNRVLELRVPWEMAEKALQPGDTSVTDWLLKHRSRFLQFEEDSFSSVNSTNGNHLISSTSSASPDSTGGRYISVTDVCVLDAWGSCKTSNPLELYTTPALWGAPIRVRDYPNYINYKTEQPYRIDSMMGNITKRRLSGSTTVVYNATAFAFRLDLNGATEVRPFSSAWEQGLITLLDHLKVPGIQFYVKTDRSVNDELSIASTLQAFDLLRLAVASIFVCIFTVVMNSSKDRYRSKFMPAFVGVLSTGLAYGGGVGLCHLLGMRHVPPAEGTPFLVLGIGVDDVFVLINAYSLTYLHGDDARKRIGLTLRDAGISITITTLTNIMAFAIGAASVYYSIYVFCILTASGLLAGYILCLTLFLGVLSLDARKEMEHRSVCIVRSVTQTNSNADDKKSLEEEVATCGECASDALDLPPRTPERLESQKESVIKAAVELCRSPVDESAAVTTSTGNSSPSAGSDDKSPAFPVGEKLGENELLNIIGDGAGKSGRHFTIASSPILLEKRENGISGNGRLRMPSDREIWSPTARTPAAVGLARVFSSSFAHARSNADMSARAGDRSQANDNDVVKENATILRSPLSLNSLPPNRSPELQKNSDLLDGEYYIEDLENHLVVAERVREVMLKKKIVWAVRREARREFVRKVRRNVQCVAADQPCPIADAAEVEESNWDDGPLDADDFESPALLVSEDEASEGREAAVGKSRINREAGFQLQLPTLPLQQLNNSSAASARHHPRWPSCDGRQQPYPHTSRNVASQFPVTPARRVGQIIGDESAAADGMPAADRSGLVPGSADFENSPVRRQTRNGVLHGSSRPDDCNDVRGSAAATPRSERNASSGHPGSIRSGENRSASRWTRSERSGGDIERFVSYSNGEEEEVDPTSFFELPTPVDWVSQSQYRRTPCQFVLQREVGSSRENGNERPQNAAVAESLNSSASPESERRRQRHPGEEEGDYEVEGVRQVVDAEDGGGDNDLYVQRRRELLASATFPLSGDPCDPRRRRVQVVSPAATPTGAPLSNSAELRSDGASVECHALPEGALGGRESKNVETTFSDAGSEPSEPSSLQSSVFPRRENRLIRVNARRLVPYELLCFDEPKGTVGSFARNFFMNHYGPFITKGWVKALVLLSFFSGLLYCGYNCSTVRAGLSLIDVTPYRSYLRDFYFARELYFDAYGDEVVVFFPEETQWWDRGVQDALLTLSDKIEKESSTVFVINGLKHFLLEYRSRLVRGTKEEFGAALTEWLDTPRGRMFNTSIKFVDGKILHWKFYYWMQFLDNSRVSISWIQTVQGFLKTAEDGGYFKGHVFTPLAVMWETDPVIFAATMSNMIVALLTMAAVASLLIPDIRSALMVLAVIVMIDINVFGVMPLWGLNLNMLTMVNLVISIGFAVDYTAHITHCFSHCKGETRNHRVVETLVLMGLPVTNGMISTYAAVAVLSTSDKYVMIVTFQMMTSVLIFSFLHGVVLMPVVLSLIGPFHQRTFSVVRIENGREVEGQGEVEGFLSTSCQKVSVESLGADETAEGSEEIGGADATPRRRGAYA